MLVGRGHDDDEDDEDDGDNGDPPALVPFSQWPVDVVVVLGADANAAALAERFVEAFGGEMIEFVRLSRP